MTLNRLALCSLLAVFTLLAVEDRRERLRAAPDGPPDFQGMWLNDTATPLERPLALASKPYFTEQEAREFEKDYLVAGLIERSTPERRAFVVDATQPDIDTFEPGRVPPDHSRRHRRGRGERRAS